MPACGNCGASAKLKCAGCKIVYFCDRACQLENWKQHKPHCRKAAVNAPVQELSRKDVVKQLGLTEEGRPYDAPVFPAVCPDAPMMSLEVLAACIAAGEGNSIAIPELGARKYFGPFGVNMRTGPQAVHI
jgi:MYND finger